MIRIGLYLEPDTRREWFVVRVRMTTALRAFHGCCYATFRLGGHTLGAFLPRPVLEFVMDILRSGCWCKPGWIDHAELQTRTEWPCCRAGRCGGR